MQNPKRKQWIPANREQSFALCEMQYALLSGVFESKKDVKDAELHFHKVTGCYKWRHPDTGTVYDNAVHLELLVPCTLNSQAESILLAIIKISGTDGQRIDSDQPMLPSFDPPTGNAGMKGTVQILCTKYELLKTAGMDTGKANYLQLENPELAPDRIPPYLAARGLACEPGLRGVHGGARLVVAPAHAAARARPRRALRAAPGRS